MDLKVKRSSLAGEIAVPGSKSHTIRAIAIATMAEGVSKIYAPLISGDTLSAVDAARAFGAEVDMGDEYWTVKGCGGKMSKPTTIDMGNSGTSLRIFTGLSALSDVAITFDGDSSLRTRPMNQLINALLQLGVEFDSNNGKCPITVKGPIKGGETTVDGTSSQFLTSLLFALPLADSDSVVKVVNLNEQPYVEITLGWLDKQGIKYKNEGLNYFEIPGRQSYTAYEGIIPADFSTATFPLVAAAVTGSRLKIKNLDFEDKQGDKMVFDYLAKMGMTVIRGDEYTEVFREGPLKGCDIDLNATPDALPAISVAACFAEGTTKLYNVAQARIKETDRIDCMTKELTKLGAKITELDDGMIIEGGHPLTGCEVEGHHDHRIVMALAIAGMAIESGEVTVKGAEAAAVTYPTFVESFSSVGANITVVE